MSLVKVGAVGANATAPAEMVFGTASLSEVEAVLITAFVAALIAVWGIITQRIVTRRLSTLQHLTTQDADGDILKARVEFNKLSDPSGKLAHYTKPSDLTDSETNSIKVILNDYEIISVGVQAGIFDLAILRLYIKGTVLRDWVKAAPFVFKLRAEVDNDLIYYEFENLASWMRDNQRPKRRTWMKLWF